MTRLAVDSMADELVAALEELGTADRASNEKRYLKSPPEISHIGVTVPNVRRVAKAFSKSHNDIEHEGLIALVGELWARQVHETRMAAIELLSAHSKSLTIEDAALIEKMIADSHTWAYVDSLAATTMGGLLDRFPELTKTLDHWAEHENFWLRRASMLALLGPIRRGDGDFERFGRYAESMLHEKEFFISKTIGWVLRETSKKRPELVNEWLTTRAHLCSGLTVREATKYLPAEQAKVLLAAAKTGVPVE